MASGAPDWGSAKWRKVPLPVCRPPALCRDCAPSQGRTSLLLSKRRSAGWPVRRRRSPSLAGEEAGPSVERTPCPWLWDLGRHEAFLFPDEGPACCGDFKKGVRDRQMTRDVSERTLSREACASSFSSVWFTGGGESLESSCAGSPRRRRQLLSIELRVSHAWGQSRRPTAWGPGRGGAVGLGGSAPGTPTCRHRRQTGERLSPQTAQRWAKAPPGKRGTATPGL